MGWACDSAGAATRREEASNPSEDKGTQEAHLRPMDGQPRLTGLNVCTVRKKNRTLRGVKP